MAHLLLRIPLFHSSRSFVTLNLNKETLRWIRGTRSSECISDEVGHTGQSPLQNYWNRPTEFEEFFLFKLNLTYKFVNRQWKKSTKENIVWIWPHLSPVRQGPQWEEFCQTKVLLHVKHRNVEQLTENGDIRWTTLYNRFIGEINKDSNNFLGQAVDNEEEIDKEEELRNVKDEDD